MKRNDMGFIMNIYHCHFVKVFHPLKVQSGIYNNSARRMYNLMSRVKRFILCIQDEKVQSGVQNETVQCGVWDEKAQCGVWDEKAQSGVWDEKVQSGVWDEKIHSCVWDENV